MTNHLWQSTWFAVAAGLLAWALRKNRAAVRYWLWFSASVKFLVPFAVLMSWGSRLEWATAAREIATPAVAFAVEQIVEPFPVAATTSLADWRPAALLAVWACGFAAIGWIRLRGWLRIRDAVRASTPVDIAAEVEVRSSPGLIEPGVVGLWRPILLLPAGIEQRLPAAQLEAVLAHELSHVRRRDNVTATVHMVVEAVFWFHPLVWWVGAKLVEERERACDEEVLRLGSEPAVYAEGILRVCKLYVESPLRCVAGVTGSNLKKRIEGILANRTALRLNSARKAALAAAAATALGVPVIIGMMQPPGWAQSTEERPQFEVASIKPSDSEDRRPLFDVKPQLFRTANVTVNRLIQVAYGIKGFQITNGPAWVGSDLFDIHAKPANAAKPDQLNLMLQSLLAERFLLVMRRETRAMPGYALVTARSGLKIPVAAGGGRPPVLRIRRGVLVGQELDMTGFAMQLSNLLGHAVVDKTGLTGRYDLKLEWSPDEHQAAVFQAMGVPEAPAAEAPGPSIFSALQEQLGLKLESQRVPVETFAIERIEKPTTN